MEAQEMVTMEAIPADTGNKEGSYQQMAVSPLLVGILTLTHIVTRLTHQWDISR